MSDEAPPPQPVLDAGDVSNEAAKANKENGTVKENGSSSAPESSGYNTPMTEHTGIGTGPITATGKDDSLEGPIRVPFARPLPGVHPTPRAAPTPEQQKKYETVLSMVSEWTELPSTSAKNAMKEPIKEHERMWLTRECLFRYLRATKWNTTEAVRRLQQTLTWRREYGADAITADHVSVEGETGKQFILGFDNDARPCLYQFPGRQNTKKSERQIQHLVWLLDRVVEMMPPEQEMCAILINFKNSTAGGSPSVGQGKQVLNILQGHYPERLGRALISDLPWFVSTFFKLISPLIDPVTREKMKFNEPIRNFVPPAQLDKVLGGDADFEYDHATYWPALVKMCDERRAAYRDRWEKAGRRIGEYEAYLRGGEQQPLAEAEKQASA